MTGFDTPVPQSGYLLRVSSEVRGGHSLCLRHPRFAITRNRTSCSPPRRAAASAPSQSIVPVRRDSRTGPAHLLCHWFRIGNVQGLLPRSPTDRVAGSAGERPRRRRAADRSAILSRYRRHVSLVSHHAAPRTHPRRALAFRCARGCDAHDVSSTTPSHELRCIAARLAWTSTPRKSMFPAGCPHTSIQRMKLRFRP
jgi:hypothetical protein